MTTGIIYIDGYNGRTGTVVEIIGSTPKRLKIRAITMTRLAGPDRWLRPGQTALVPPYAVSSIVSGQ